MNAEFIPFAALPPESVSRAGGKGNSLAKLARAGLPVPPGFIISTQLYRTYEPRGFELDAAFLDGLQHAYHELGEGIVAVRSSATAEDGAQTSFAGQQETILGVEGIDALASAVRQCWQSLHTDRALAYRAQQQLDSTNMAMAVVVQRLILADTAGVLFTQDPTDPGAGQMTLEASYGLGETVVSGLVTPDRWRIDATTGAIVQAIIGSKRIRRDASGESVVAPADTQRFCLSDADLVKLVELGRTIEQFEGGPRDLEWAICEGKLYLLQSRPITSTAADRQRIIDTAREQLRRLADPKGTVWVRYNLSEVLPEPTPMTWSIVNRLLAADGGFGQMTRDLGASPDPSLQSESAFDLVAGRPMANLSKLPRMQFARPPFRYPFEVFKADPNAALNPQQVLDPLSGRGWLGLLGLPGVVWRLWKNGTTTRKLAAHFATDYRTTIAPPFRVACQQALTAGCHSLSSEQLLQKLHEWITRTLIDFARHSLKPTVFANFAWSQLVEQLKGKLGDAEAAVAVGELALGATPDEGTGYAAAIRGLASGRISEAEFLATFGHRAAHEMELARPRWSEDPAAIAALKRTTIVNPPLPSVAEATAQRIAAAAKLSGPFLDLYTKNVAQLRTYLGLRETGKHDLLLGYAIIRMLLVELDTRFALRGGIFELTLSDLPKFIAGDDLSSIISASRRDRQLARTIPVPIVLLSYDLEAIGRPAIVPLGATTFRGVGLSAGIAEANALVLNEPSVPPEGFPEGYILVCPSTDPAWVPLFARAKGLVMETGGVLSHGAIVAREFGLPAVASLPGILEQIRTGTRLRIDGGTGSVSVLNSET